MIRQRQPGSRVRRGTLGLIFLLSVALTGSATVPLTVAANSGLLGGGSAAMIDLAMQFAPSPSFWRMLDQSEAISYGTDNRLTFLLLGSDYRTHKPAAGERTDMITLVTINRSTKRMAAAGFPRDLANIPLPNGTIHTGRINELLKKYTASKGRAGAAQEVRKIFAHLTKTEIDYVAVMRFNGFNNMMDELGSIRVTTRPARDPKLQDGVPVGVLFPSATNWELWGNGERCRGHFRFTTDTSLPGYYCHRALMYARTRKGPANSDFKRQNRGIDIVMAGIKKATGASYGSAKIGSMVSKAQAQGVEFYSSMPMTVANATELYNLMKGATLTKRVVFKPKTYATKISGTAKYSIKVAAVRNWINNNFKNP